MTILSFNQEWGFFGTAQRNYNFTDEATARLFDYTAQALVKKLKLPIDQVRCFMDGRYGRHFADELSFHGAKDGMTEKQFVNVVRKYLANIDRNQWVEKEASKQEIYMAERSV